MIILVASSDNAIDTFMPFHYCIEKYWPEHPEVIYSTETVINPYYKTINKNYPISEWSKRIHDTVAEIDDNQILLMCEDVFIRTKVDNNLIKTISTYINDEIGSINFESSFDKFDSYYNDLLFKRPKQGAYKTSVMCSLWNKCNMLKVFDISCDPWEFEKINNHCGFVYLISSKKSFINWGWDATGKRKWFGLHAGKWCLEAKEFFDKEGLKINYNRGFDNC